MFARHTQARRMKKTGVVQGLKSLADKIHPNGSAPLTANESKRLLTALTSSFRRHLDAAHPSTVEVEKKKRAQQHGPPHINVSGIHSSAAFAQKHMASVLTNPLLMKGGKDYGSAKVELAKNPHKDPIELLEQYEKEGVATVRIAELCLENVRKEYDTVPEARKSKLLEELQPGRRVFLWLLQSGQYMHRSCVDNVPFLELLVHFLLREGRQKELWQWLKLDFQAPDPPEGAPRNTTYSYKKRMVHYYRWRGRLLASMVQNVMNISWQPLPGKTQVLRAGNLHSAIGIIADAVNLQKSVSMKGEPKDWPHLAWIPLGHTITYVVKLLTRRLQPYNDRGDVKLKDGDRIDPARYDELIAYAPLGFDVAVHELARTDKWRDTWMRIDAANLHLHHPSSPSAEPLLHILRLLMPDQRSESNPKFLAALQDQAALRSRWGHSIVEGASIFTQHGKHEEAAWVRGRIPLYVPEFVGYEAIDERRADLARTQLNSDQGIEVPQSMQRIPFPSFA
ncbi:hypothetical protein Slin15195_G085130 [Septoria linicola]|uniref:Uncharacterized protein n=1 Tax=Septoria linicola TaxID=215465 RepID=A0A9Q9AUS1_9PEZI|nr:hypothetical protein Slin14017_G087690 [Septoria linicola]USW55194.1 hypothetical protein Slin15195_G085130 [Septoria linicola]